jgi:hypothetical protein
VPDYLSMRDWTRAARDRDRIQRIIFKLTHYQNLEAAVALHYMYYNFARIHQTLRVTPAMEAGISDHVWDLEEVIALLDASGR